MRSFNVSNKDALNQQGDYDFKYAAIDILHDYIENPNVEFRSELLDIKNILIQILERLSIAI